MPPPLFGSAAWSDTLQSFQVASGAEKRLVSSFLSSFQPQLSSHRHMRVHATASCPITLLNATDPQIMVSCLWFELCLGKQAAIFNIIMLANYTVLIGNVLMARSLASGGLACDFNRLFLSSPKYDRCLWTDTNTLTALCRRKSTASGHTLQLANADEWPWKGRPGWGLGVNEMARCTTVECCRCLILSV